jgi:nitroimidazol reductase NimA-like FMN-containing flavoprotein (pyridoxamine 5'-phosphate oxidase superfamily)
MAIDRRTEMSLEETDAFLGSQETGVLSLARADEPYAIPISYGYDPTARQFYMRLVSTPESEKRLFLESDPDARLVVYDEDERTYRSAIAVGTLVGIDPDELTVEDIRQYGSAKRPLFDIWPDGKDELDIELYKFEPEMISGRLIAIPEGG